MSTRTVVRRMDAPLELVWPVEAMPFSTCDLFSATSTMMIVGYIACARVEGGEVSADH